MLMLLQEYKTSVFLPLLLLRRYVNNQATVIQYYLGDGIKTTFLLMLYSMFSCALPINLQSTQCLAAIKPTGNMW